MSRGVVEADDPPVGVERWTGDLKFVGWHEPDERLRTRVDQEHSMMRAALRRDWFHIGAGIVFAVASVGVAAATAQGAWLPGLLVGLAYSGRRFLVHEVLSGIRLARLMALFAHAKRYELYELSRRPTAVAHTDPPSFDFVDPEPRYFGLSREGTMMFDHGSVLYFDSAEFYDVRPELPLYETTRPWRIQELTQTHQYEKRALTADEGAEVLRYVFASLWLVGLLGVFAWIAAAGFAMREGQRDPSSPEAILTFLLAISISARFWVKFTQVSGLLKDRKLGYACRRYEDGTVFEWLPNTLAPWTIDDEAIRWRYAKPPLL